jgi:CAAX protease family protein
VIEFCILFLVLPTLFYWGRFHVPALPVLWLLTAYCLAVLWREGRLGAAGLTPITLANRLPYILAVFLPFALAVTWLVNRYAPRDLFSLVRQKPTLWAAIMAAYPVFSVYPQGIVFRAFFFDRYRTLFPSTWLLVLMSAAAFTYLHIVFRNWIAVVLTAFGGLLFAMRYVQTGSLFVSCFEHTLYGCWLFTVGLGRWFFYRDQFEPSNPTGTNH